MWQQVAGSGVIHRPMTAVPSARDAKESETLHNPTTSRLRGSIWRRSGSLWRSSASQTRLNTVFLVSLIDNLLVYTQSGNFKPLNLTEGSPYRMANRRSINRPDDA